jgi:LysM repeat protein
VVGVAVVLSVAACGHEITPEPTEVARGGTPVPGGLGATPTLRLTATAPILPPADTATPTLTPTPIIHVIESGDTLYSIAFEYGVNPDALQEVNNIDDPRFLRIGQELIIPTEQEEDDGTSNLLLPTPTPEPVSVRGVAFYETPVGSLWCLGEIANTTGAPLTNVQIKVLLFDSEGILVAEEDAFAASDLISPGERSPFGILFTSPPAGWVNSQVVIMRGEAAGDLAAGYAPLTLSDVSAEPVGDQLRVGGVVANASAGQAVGSLTIIVTTYGGQGKVTGFRQSRVELASQMAPGSTVPFEVRLGFHGDEPSDFNVVALGRVGTQ